MGTTFLGILSQWNTWNSVIKHVDLRLDRCTLRQAEMHTDRQIEKHTVVQKDRETYRLPYCLRQSSKKTNKQSDSLTVTSSHVDKQTNGQTPYLEIVK